MIRIGVVNIDTSHPKAFSEYLMKGDRARYTAIYNDGFRWDDEVEAFIKKYGLEKRCTSIPELAGYTDIGFIQGCNWDLHVEHAMPFIERGKPVFIDKPFAGNMRDCMKMKELAKRGAVILGSSSLRYAGEIASFLKIPAAERGEIVNVFGTAGVDEFNYGIHVAEGIDGIINKAAVSCRFAGTGVKEAKACDTYYVRYVDGASAIYNTFKGTWQPFEIVIMTTLRTYQFRVDTKAIYGAMLDRICDFMESGGKTMTMATVDELVQSVSIMLAGRISMEKGGAEVPISDIPGDYAGFDGYEFEKGYAAASKKIYV